MGKVTHKEVLVLLVMPSVTGAITKVILMPYEKVSIKKGEFASAPTICPEHPKLHPYYVAMATRVTELSSLDVVKSRLRLSTKRFTEFDQEAVPLSKHRTTKPSWNHLWDIEVIKESGLKTKIHYEGYSQRHDEWIRKSQIVYKPTAASIPTKQLSLHSVLACTIKQKLVLSRKYDDPAVRLQLPFDTKTFVLLQQQGR